MSGQRRQLARIIGLVEREQDDGQRRMIAEAVEQRLQLAHILCRDRQIAADIPAIAGEQFGIVIAEHAGMDLHHHAVVARHARELGQHLGAEQLRIAGLALAAQQTVEQRLAVGSGEIGSLHRRRTMIGRRCAMGAEVGAASFVRCQISLPVRGAEALDIGGEIRAVGIDDIVGAVIGEDAARPFALRGRVIFQRVQRAFGGGDLLDVEALEQRARPERRASMPRPSRSYRPTRSSTAKICSR